MAIADIVVAAVGIANFVMTIAVLLEQTVDAALLHATATPWRSEHGA